jgi:hypothetical protein
MCVSQHHKSNTSIPYIQIKNPAGNGRNLRGYGKNNGRNGEDNKKTESLHGFGLNFMHG